MSHYKSSRPEDIPPEAWAKMTLGAFDELHARGHDFLHALAQHPIFKQLLRC
jgi:hypothetical protein